MHSDYRAPDAWDNQVCQKDHQIEGGKNHISNRTNYDTELTQQL